MATSGKEWRKARENGIEITLASGMSVALRPIEVDLFVRVGHIPDALAQVVNDMINGKDYAVEVPTVEKLEQSKDWIEFLNEMIKFAFVNPKVVDAPQADDEISIDDVSYQDKLYVYRFFSRPARVLEAFRQTQTNPVASIFATAERRSEAEQSTEDKPVGRKNHSPARLVDRATV